MAIAHHRANLSRATLHYVTAGEGEPVVLLHGWPQSWYAWRRVIPLLAARYHVIAPDLPGLGDSRRADGPDSASYDKAALAGELRELLAGALGLARFHLVGHDWGGPTAFALAAAHPDQVRSLTVLDVTIPGIGPDISQGGKRWHHGFHMTPDLPEALVEGRERTYLGWFYRTFSHRQDAVGEDDLAEYLRSYAEPAVLRAGFALYRALPRDIAANQALLARGFRLTMPVLALGGAETASRGRAHEPAESLRCVAADVTGGVVAASGHLIPEEQPDALAAALLAFLASHPIAKR